MTQLSNEHDELMMKITASELDDVTPADDGSPMPSRQLCYQRCAAPGSEVVSLMNELRRVQNHHVWPLMFNTYVEGTTFNSTLKLTSSTTHSLTLKYAQ